MKQKKMKQKNSLVYFLQEFFMLVAALPTPPNFDYSYKFAQGLKLESWALVQLRP